MDERPEFGSEAAPASPKPRHRARGIIVALCVGALLGGALVGGGFLIGSRSAVQAPATTELGAAGAPVTTSIVASQPLEAAAAKVVPSVVNVAIETPSGAGVGSGVIIRPDGYILTNNHVVEGATRITVRFGTADLVARVVGADSTSDLAVIKVAKTGLPVAAMGDSTIVRVGETVLAVGSPFGLDKTVTSGIVSALHRSNLAQSSTGITAYTNLIQTDAAINPGNSGGALANLAGQVVGINALIQSPSGEIGAAQSAGIGFAIPIDFARSIADRIIAGTPITHPYLGVSSVSVTPAFAQIYGMPVSQGALVQDVASGSPADDAGIRVGDIIVSVGGHAIASTEDLFAAVQSANLGKPTPFEIVRRGIRSTVDVTIVAR